MHVWRALQEANEAHGKSTWFAWRRPLLRRRPRARKVCGTYIDRRLPFSKVVALPIRHLRDDCSGFVTGFEQMALDGTGPTGWKRGADPIRRISACITVASDRRRHRVSFLNETVVRVTKSIINSSQSAFYLHADDGLSFHAAAETLTLSCMSLLLVLRTSASELEPGRLRRNA